jgi:hypothetical protein
MAGARPREGIQARLARLRGRLGAAAAAGGRRALVAVRGETAERLGRLAALTLALAVLVVVLYDHGDVPSAAARGAGGRAAAAEGAPGGAAPAAPGREAGGAGSAAPGGKGPGAGSGGAGPGDAGRGEAASGGSGDAASGRSDAATSGGRGDAAASGGRNAGTAGERAPAKVKRPATPAEVAVAWYAARHKLPRSRVRPLQQDRVSARQVRVLVLAQAANGKLRTALVRVRLGPGGWEVR